MIVAAAQALLSALLRENVCCRSMAHTFLAVHLRRPWELKGRRQKEHFVVEVGLHFVDSRLEALDRPQAASDNTETARVGHSSRKSWVRHRAHARKYNGMLDPQEVGHMVLDFLYTAYS